MKSLGPKVTMRYIGQPTGNSQDPDEPYDNSPGVKSRPDGIKIGGMGAQGSGSKPTPQRTLTTTGSGSRGGSRVHNTGSYPRRSQQLRGK